MHHWGARKVPTVQLAGHPRQFLSHCFEREVRQKEEAYSTTELPSVQYQGLCQAEGRKKRVSSIYNNNA